MQWTSKDLMNMFHFFVVAAWNLRKRSNTFEYLSQILTRQSNFLLNMVSFLRKIYTKILDTSKLFWIYSEIYCRKVWYFEKCVYKFEYCVEAIGFLSKILTMTVWSFDEWNPFFLKVGLESFGEKFWDSTETSKTLGTSSHYNRREDLKVLENHLNFWETAKKYEFLSVNLTRTVYIFVYSY